MSKHTSTEHCDIPWCSREPGHDGPCLPHSAIGCWICGGVGCEECDGTGQRVITALEIDGNTVMVHGTKPLSDDDRAALAEVYRAAISSS